MAKKTKMKMQTDDQAPIEVPIEPSTSAPTSESEEIPKAPTSLFNPDGELVVDVFETDKHFVVLAAIAGVQIKDLDISVEKDMMVIKGHRLDPHDHPEKKFFYQECYWGPFSRKIVLPENVDTNAADAQMDKGMLTISIPKTSTEKMKRTDVRES